MVDNMKTQPSLNIKNAEAHQLARALADETGESMTDVVTEALREKLDRVRSRNKRDAMLRAMREISARTAELLKGPPIDHAEMLYDENGLPK
jgi:antitoxin VapB